ncbi:hypothetical protein V0R48_09540 [Pseudomonas alcaligenes]|uniref:hypothetical protein n=1 Tax=Aquipseudomonas alcaligenes TaxID=43263 RepID=UPI002E7B5165|nr:hypothetical protein [Pseudomonas alcaligenes]MEE1949215.1 hypothetical protein [Pseudomonas alcaligenes]
MSPDYQADYWVRRARLFGWGLILVMALAVVLALGWKIAEVSELRAMDATRAHLAASLSGLAAEQMAKDRVLDEAWKRKNPFVLLRWQQDNYCGELTAPGEPQAGCWYWLPPQAWVLYRTRFADGWKGRGHELHAWRLVVVPERLLAASQFANGPFVLELEEVPHAELSAQGF